MRTLALFVIVISILLIGLAISLNQVSTGKVGISGDTLSENSNFTRKASQTRSNGSSFLLIPGGSMGYSTDVGDLDSDGTPEIVTVSTDTDANLLQMNMQSSLRVWKYSGDNLTMVEEKT